MQCKNFLCIYQKAGQCRAESISMNVFGMCGNCVIVDVQDENWDELKEQWIRELSSKFISEAP